MVFLNEFNYRLQISGVKLSGEKITGSASSVPAVSECAEIELKEYVAHVRALAELLRKYKQMIETDCQSVYDSIDTVKEADRQASLEIIRNAVRIGLSAVSNTPQASANTADV